MENFKICRKCGIKKSLKFFYTYKASKNKKYYMSNICIDCCRKLKGSSLERYLKELLNNHGRNEKKIDMNYILYIYNKQKGRCKYTNLPMTYIRGNGYTQTNISLDRINSKKGYIKGNIQLVCRWANSAKHVVSHKDFIELCRLVAQNNPNIYK